MSHDKICTCNVSVVRINGNTRPVGALLFAPMMPRDLVLGRVCLSHVKVVLRDVLGRVDLHACVSGCKLVT